MGVDGRTGLPVALADLGRAYHLIRVCTSGTVLLVGLALALAWERHELAIVAAAGAVAGADALVRRRVAPARIVVPLALDTVAVGVAMIVSGLPLPIMGAPFASLVTAALLLLPPRQAGGSVAHACLWVLLALVLAPHAGASWTPLEELVLSSVAVTAFFGQTGALILVTARALRRRQEALEQLVRSKDDFLASVSHELRTPLTAVVGFARQLVERDGELSDAERAELAGIVASEAQEVADIVDDLLVAARADVGMLSVRPSVVPVEACARRVLRLMPEQPRPVVVEGAARAWADPARLRQILRNLVSNAQRYGEGSISIRVGEEEGWALVEVMDEGSGVPREEVARIFEPYQRGGEGDGQPMSMGLGLHVARTLARLMGGELGYRRSGGSTVFELRLPAPASEVRPDGETGDLSTLTVPG